jgi:hypothetical protein
LRKASAWAPKIGRHRATFGEARVAIGLRRRLIRLHHLALVTRHAAILEGSARIRRARSKRCGRLYAFFMLRLRISHRSFARRPATAAAWTRGIRVANRHPSSSPGRIMIDIFLLALGVCLFGLMAAYAAGCERV